MMGDGGTSGGALSVALKNANFDRNTKRVVEVPFKTATVDGGSDVADVNMSVRSAPALGADERFLFPLLPTESITFDTTAVQSFRQKSRNTGTPSDGIRAINATTTKPEVATVTEIVNDPTKQIAWVETGVPNVYLENMAFRGWIDNDLRLAFSKSVDWHVTNEIALAYPTPTPFVGNAFEDVVHAVETVLSAGYNPTVLAAAPEYLIALDLMLQPGTGDYVAGALDNLLARLRRVAVPGLTYPLVFDPSAAGTFHVSPSRFGTFEENAGATNTSTVRLEATGLFVVQRLSAITQIAPGS